MKAKWIGFLSVLVMGLAQAQTPSFVVDDKHSSKDWERVEAVVEIEVYRIDRSAPAPQYIASLRSVVPVHAINNQDVPTSVEPSMIDFKKRVEYVQEVVKTGSSFDEIKGFVDVGLDASVLLLDTPDGFLGKFTARNAHLLEMDQIKSKDAVLELPRIDHNKFSSIIHPGINTLQAGSTKLVVTVTLQPASDKPAPTSLPQNDNATASPPSAASGERPKTPATITPIPEEKPAPVEFLD